MFGKVESRLFELITHDGYYYYLCPLYFFGRKRDEEKKKKSGNLGLTILHARLETHSFQFNHRKLPLSHSHPLTLIHTRTHARTTHILEGVSSPSKCMIHILSHCMYVRYSHPLQHFHRNLPLRQVTSQNFNFLMHDSLVELSRKLTFA